MEVLSEKRWDPVSLLYNLPPRQADNSQGNCCVVIYTCCGFGFGTSGSHSCIYEKTEAELEKLPCGWGS